MIVVLAIDALEYDLVERFNCRHLMQKYYGKTDISEFSEPRTMVLWSSFMAGKNMEKEVLALGDRGMWDFRLDIKDTFFKEFKDPAIIDLPGFNYDGPQHAKERELLKQYFDASNSEEKEAVRKEYNEHAFAHHRNIKAEFAKALGEGHDFVLGYFSVADVVGHLNFGNTMLMKMIYKDIDEIAAGIKENFIVLSDHGMEAIGMFGDHSGYGFWSTNFNDLDSPRISDFYYIVPGSGPARRPEAHNIVIREELFEKLEKIAGDAGFTSVDALVNSILEELTSSKEDNYRAEDENQDEEMKERLKKMGYF